MNLAELVAIEEEAKRLDQSAADADQSEGRARKMREMDDFFTALRGLLTDCEKSWTAENQKRLLPMVRQQLDKFARELILPIEMYWAAEGRRLRGEAALKRALISAAIIQTSAELKEKNRE